MATHVSFDFDPDDFQPAPTLMESGRFHLSLIDDTRSIARLYIVGVELTPDAVRSMATRLLDAADRMDALLIAQAGQS